MFLILYLAQYENLRSCLFKFPKPFCNQDVYSCILKLNQKKLNYNYSKLITHDVTTEDNLYSRNLSVYKKCFEYLRILNLLVHSLKRKNCLLIMLLSAAVKINLYLNMHLKDFI